MRAFSLENLSQARSLCCGSLNPQHSVVAGKRRRPRVSTIVSRLSFVLALAAMTGAGEAQGQQASGGYLSASDYQQLQQSFPPAPPSTSVEQQADEAGYQSSRNLVGTARGEIAAADDVYSSEEVAPRFADALGVTLTDQNAPRFMALISAVAADAQNQVHPIKLSVADGGRHRPILDHPSLPHCPITYAGLADTGSYPSGHAELGWLWGSILAKLASDRSAKLLARGYDFGESRLVCGFHWSSDVVSGRFAAEALLGELNTKPAFLAGLEQARQEILKARSGANAQSDAHQ